MIYMNLIQQFSKSFYSPKTISLFRFQGIGKTIRYIFFLMFIATLITYWTFSFHISHYINETKTFISNETPDFTIFEGHLSPVTYHQPAIIDENNYLLIFDPNKDVKIEEITRKQFALALYKNQALLTFNYTTHSFPYALIETKKVSKEDLLLFLQKLQGLLPILIPFLFLIMFIFFTALKFIGISFLALCGLVIIRWMKRVVNYRQMWRISAYCVTLPTILFSFIKSLNIEIPFAFSLYWLISLVVLYTVLKKIPPKKKS